MSKTASGPQNSGGKFLAKKSDVTKARKDLPAINDILIVEDEHFDADRLKATLHVMFGYKIEIRRATTLGNALDCVIERQPQIIFLDDYLQPEDNAANTIPFLRRCNYDGPIVVVSSLASTKRRAALKQAGAADLIHKDDINTVRIGEILTKIYSDQSNS